VAAADVDGDGSVDLTVAFTNETANGSSATMYVSYDYWI
jgi:hypothetical protein